MNCAASHQFLLNPLSQRPGDMPASVRAAIRPEGFDAAMAEVGHWPGYAPTPLVNLPRLAADLGLGELSYKDESKRFGLGSFKALGGAYAVARLSAAARAAGGGPLTVATATDGNHGRSVAWGARTFGCEAVIYVHETVSAARAEAIAAFGARVVRTPGNYDEAVRRAAADAAKFGWTVVSDTSYDDYVSVPRQVMHGYGVMVLEALDQLEAPPTHVFLQAGVGALAAAVLTCLWDRLGASTPRIVVVEPDRAACLFESAVAGRPVVVDGALDTIMAGLACGEVSTLAWTALSAGADAFMTVSDADAECAMRRLAGPRGDDPPVVAGESAVAGLCGLKCAMEQPAWRDALGLSGGSRVLLFGTEGATDPSLYGKIVGATPDEVLARQGL